MQVDPYVLWSATVGGTRFNVRGLLYHGREDAGFTTWDAHAKVDAPPVELSRIPSDAQEVVFDTPTCQLRGLAFISVGARAGSGSSSWFIDFTGTGELEEL